MSWLGGQKDVSSARSGVVTVLDIGSTKICCIIGRLKPCAESERLPGRTHQVRVIGIGHQKSLGVKSGAVIDLDAA
ncbi:MAG: cell division protein FtsA, partial [Sphingomonadaceae bacterium]|nr:cell division protein FtsA [Sphingomonadaceae bacterium]